MLLFPNGAHAVPSFGRQTGEECMECHTVYPMLNADGRRFKLGGYSMSTPKPADAPFFDKVPLSALLQVSGTATRDTGTAGATDEDFPRDRDTLIQAAGLYYGGRITDRSGALVQYSYDGVERAWAMEMFDARYGGSTQLGDKEMLYGVTLNNSPTLSDIYNSTPVWAFPHTSSVSVMPAAGTKIDTALASQVGGVGVYGLWNDLLYAELAFYRTADSGVFRPLAAGVDVENVVNGTAPYWRLALQRETGPHSFAFGTYGLVAKIDAEAEDPDLGADRFRDVALDAQYQYVAGDHAFTATATWIREKQEWDASFGAGLVSNPSTILKTFRADAHYVYRGTYAGILQYFDTRGDDDALRYDTGAPVTGSANGSPDSRGWIAELNYLAEVDWMPVVQHAKFALRYTAYTQFNGAGHNYDGFGRDAKDNNSIFLLVWFLL
ncbi:MAG: hypothetical protein ROZ09_05245 [Thiobacillus sp.]|uniref:hypothetical protein n=1 Tax=Thiobacillus sp. TaxID=924 RepID=UPI002895BCEF|nr:hypothetical protein [Thiobacillus sp.]MDT3706210.1 hypothetical protein [Thiobacillus sp.]